MKIFVLIGAILFSLIQTSTFAATNEQRLAELENKVQALEAALTKKLGDCQMKYKHFGYRSNRCDEGTFARSVTDLGGGSMQLECGYYQLQCFYKNP